MADPVFILGFFAFAITVLLLGVDGIRQSRAIKRQDRLIRDLSAQLSVMATVAADAQTRPAQFEVIATASSPS